MKFAFLYLVRLIRIAGACFALLGFLTAGLSGCANRNLAVAQSTTQAPETPVPPLLIFPRAGSPKDSHVVPRGPGLMLMGGGPTVDSAFRWMHDTIVGSPHVRGGDVIVLTASEGDVYTPYIMKVATFNSVRSISIGPGATTEQLAKAASYVDRAQGVFFSGGDQAHYVRWKGSPLIKAVQRLYNRGGVVGGTSAGLAILGEFVFDSVAADATNGEVDVATADAVANPAEPTISFTHRLFSFSPMRSVITETHLVQRNRLGRCIVFLARLQAMTPHQTMAVAIDVHSAIVIDRHGIGTLKLEHGRGEALLVRLTQQTPITAGKPLIARNVRIILLNRDGQHVDFNTWCAAAPTYFINVDGAKPPYYSPANPYVAPANAISQRCASGSQ
jgi:cyanophycinase